MTLMPAGVPALLARYREIGIRLREVEAAHATTPQSIPDAIRPSASGTGKEALSRWPEWTREELDALGLHPSTPLRASLADFDRQYQRAIRKTPANWEELRRQHMARFDAWHTRRKQQKEYQRQAGLDDINQRRRHLLADKHGIERALLTLMTSPAGAFINA